MSAPPRTAVQHGLGDFLVNAGFLSDGVDDLRFCKCNNLLQFLCSMSGRTTRTPQHYKNWPLEGKKNKTADEGFESGSKTASASTAFNSPSKSGFKKRRRSGIPFV